MDAPHAELEPIFEAIRNGRMDKALELARTIAEEQEGDVALEARRHVGLCFFHLGDYGSAIPNFLQVAKARNDRQSWFVLALSRTLGGDPTGGAQDFKNALAAPEPPASDDGRQLTEHFMRFDYMHVLVDAWQWEGAKEQLDALTASMMALKRHDNQFLFERGYPLLGDLLDGGLRVLEVVPDSNPIQWLTQMRRTVDEDGRRKVDQALLALARKMARSRALAAERRHGSRGAVMAQFDLHRPFEPAGDQPQAIKELCDGLDAGLRHQVLLGATGTGKTFTMANVIAHAGMATLVLSHNKTLAAQLYGEFKRLFPNNAVEYFVSYFDYYQPEAYVAASDTYIQKDSLINEQIDRLRHRATRALLERNDVIIISSVSCIYGLGSREAYDDMLLHLQVGDTVPRRQILTKLVDILYDRNDQDFHRGTFRSRGDVIEVFPAHEEDRAIRIELFGDEVERLSLIDPLRGTRIEELEKIAVYPASHYVTPAGQIERAVQAIQSELVERLAVLRDREWLLEAQRLEERTLFDLEMIQETGRCNGIENYSRHLSGRPTGEPPPTLLEFFPKDWLLIVDESHVSVPQVGGMFHGDRARKETLVRHGFRLPSALDNRPLRFEEFEARVNQAVHVSATPSRYELEQTGGVVVEQVIRPTGLLDPTVEVRPAGDQVDDLLDEIRKVAAAGSRALVTVLTKRMAQELTDYYQDLGVRVRYLHSDIDTLERMEILRDLRNGEFDVLVGINLLREGLDLPEVSFVAILDADKEGFLRNPTSLIQTIGRAARNVDGHVILYADRVTVSMQFAIDETERRRDKQREYNMEHGITPETIRKAVDSPLADLLDGERVIVQKTVGLRDGDRMTMDSLPATLKRLRKEMKESAKRLDFEKAAELRDRIKDLEGWALEMHEAPSSQAAEAVAYAVTQEGG